MDFEVKRMSSTAIEMLDQLSIVCKRFGVDYYAASQNQRDLLDSIALHEYQLKKAHEQGLKRAGDERIAARSGQRASHGTGSRGRRSRIL